MKNLKNTLAAAAMVVVLGVGSANAGLLISDKSSTPKDCAAQSGGVLDQIMGIIIVGLNGLIMSDRDGLIITDKGCDNGNGLIMSDRDGLIITD